jgi:DNA-binding sugar fermentation-stimulating protein
MRFETPKHIERENKAMELLSKEYGLGYVKLDEWDIDFLITKEGKEIAYLEVKGRHRNIEDAFPLPLAVQK